MSDFEHYSYAVLLRLGASGDVYELRTTLTKLVEEISAEFAKSFPGCRTVVREIGGIPCVLTWRKADAGGLDLTRWVMTKVSEQGWQPFVDRGAGANTACSFRKRLQ